MGLFEKHGFSVECQEVISYTPDLPPLQRDLLAPRFRQAEEDDLRSLVTHFVAVRK